AARLAKQPAVLAEEEPQVGSWSTPIVEDPFAVSLDRKLADLDGAIGTLRAAKGVQTAEARMLWRRERKLLVSTEGTDVAQTLICGGAGIKLVVADRDRVAAGLRAEGLRGRRPGRRPRVRRRARPPPPRGAHPRGGARAPSGPALPERRARPRPRHAAARAADPRIVRPPDGARPRARRG